MRFIRFGLPALVLAALAGCTPDYSPDVYSADAVQQANKVEPGIVIGYRQVEISANGTVGTVTGGAAGGILGAQADVTGVSSALTALGGSVVGGLVGTGLEHAAGDTTGWEYIVRKSNGDMLSVTQREPKPLPIGQKVLVITGKQARIIPDYSFALEPPANKESEKEKGKDAKEKSADKNAAKEPAATTPTPVAASASAPAAGAVAPSSASAAAAPPATASGSVAPAATSIAATPAAAPSPSSASATTSNEAPAAATPAPAATPTATPVSASGETPSAASAPASAPAAPVAPASPAPASNGNTPEAPKTPSS